MRTTGSSAEKTLAALHRAGLRRLHKQGFAGMTLRELASDVGIQAGSIYNHFTNKQDFLCSVLTQVLNDLLEELHAKLEDAANPHEALMLFVECHVIFHCDRREEVLASTTELRSLTAENYRRIVELRDRYEARLKQILQWGSDEEYWPEMNFNIASKMILGMLTSVGVWYRADGPVDRHGIVKIFQSMIDGLLLKEAISS